ncbi:hypothetical protein JCM8097_006179 [Rhodosporidiobolus ruineniae]
MVRVYSRPNTHREPAPPYLASGLDYRTYNERYYEPWLERAYGKDVKPFWQEPPSSFAAYGSAVNAGIRQDSVDMIISIFRGGFAPIFCLPKNKDLNLFGKWSDATLEQREEWLLATLERQHRNAELHSCEVGRHEMPEITLSWASDSWALFSLVEAIGYKPAEQRYKHVPHPAWDRLNDWSSTLSVPPSRGCRLFTEQGKIIRALDLTQFCHSLIRTMIGKPETGFQLVKPSVMISAQADQADHDLMQEGNKRGRIVNSGSIAGSYCCSYCHRDTTDAGIKLTCCAKCRTAGRCVWYCGAECQRADWTLHKLVCGKSLLDIDTGASFSTPPAPPPSLRDQHDRLNFLENYPVAIWAAPYTLPDDGIAGEREGVFQLDLPPFVRPYVAVVEALQEVRTRALMEQNGLDIGILAYALQLVAASQSALPNSEELVLNPLIAAFGVDGEELVRKAARRVRERFESGEELEGVDKVVLAALRQLKTGEPDTSFPYQNLRAPGLTFLEKLLICDTAFYAFLAPPTPSGQRRFVVVQLPPDTPSHDRVLALLRRMAFDVVLTSARNRRAFGLLIALVHARLRIELDTPGVVPFSPSEARMSARDKLAVEADFLFGVEWKESEGLAAAGMEELARRGEKEGQEREELDLLGAALEHVLKCEGGDMTLFEPQAAVVAQKKKNKKKKKKKKGGKMPEDEKPEDAQADEGEEAAE